MLPTLSPAAHADNAAFDLIGPKVEVRVQRDKVTLPIAEVPNLQRGDRLWVHPDLPDSQSVHYLMVVVFLRGATNPPPDSWFTRVETWSKPVHDEGVFVVVPEEAEEAIVFLAPATGGAFSTLRAAVRGKPGAFVRAAQDLQQASLDRQRLEKYLETVRETYTADPEQLKLHTTMLARSLNMRLDQQCFDKPSAQQVPCLTQNTDQLVLDDAHSQSMVAALTSGTSSDLLAQISATPTARGGYYSPYIGAVVDLARILGTTHTAQYQYIPALALPKENELNLRLNNPPSFRNPKSVLVIGLPPVRAVAPPPLRAVDSAQVLCAGKPALFFPPTTRLWSLPPNSRIISFCMSKPNQVRASTCPLSPIPCAADSSSIPSPCSPPTSTARSPAFFAEAGASTPSTVLITACEPHGPRNGSWLQKMPALSLLAAMTHFTSSPPTPVASAKSLLKMSRENPSPPNGKAQSQMNWK